MHKNVSAKGDQLDEVVANEGGEGEGGKGGGESSSHGTHMTWHTL